VIEPQQAGLSPEQLRQLCKEVMEAYSRLRGEELDTISRKDSK